MGGNQIHNVAAGTAATDAVNVSQLNNVVTNIGNGMGEMSNRINRLDDRVDRVGAGAAAWQPFILGFRSRFPLGSCSRCR